MRIIGVYVNFIIAAKYLTADMKQHLENDCPVVFGQGCYFGRCWWFWVPHVRVSLRFKIKSIDIFFLKYLITFTWMRKS